MTKQWMAKRSHITNAISELYKIVVNKVTFVGFRGSIASIAPRIRTWFVIPQQTKLDDAFRPGLMFKQCKKIEISSFAVFGAWYASILPSRRSFQTFVFFCKSRDVTRLSCDVL